MAAQRIKLRDDGALIIFVVSLRDPLPQFFKKKTGIFENIKKALLYLSDFAV